MNHTQKMLSEMLDLCVAYQMGLENKNDGYNAVLILLRDEAERLRDERNIS